MLEIAWLILNLALGVPLALVAIVVLREGLRVLIALALGFRVFELRLGIGRAWLAAPIGPIDFALGPWPLGGATIAASGAPRHHRMARGLLALAPLGVQLLALAALATRPEAAPSALAQGPAPLAVLALANGALVLLHALLPKQWAPEVETDVRAFLDLSVAPPDQHRHARAEYYARTARHALERADVARAHSALERGLTQLGREALLVDCEAQLAARELDSVVDQGESADALLAALRRAVEQRGRRAPGAIATLRRAGLYALPGLCALLVAAFVQRDMLGERLTRYSITVSASIADAGDPDACAERLRVVERGWRRGASPKSTLLRDRLHQRARLQACRGDFERALADQRAALAAAEAAQARHIEALAPDDEGWLADELERVALLRLGARLERTRGHYRVALQTLAQADQELWLLRQRLLAGLPEVERERFATRIDAAAQQIESARSETLSKLAAR